MQEAAVRITEGTLLSQSVVICGAAETRLDFLEHRPLPDPMSTSETAREMLTVDDKPTA